MSPRTKKILKRTLLYGGGGFLVSCVGLVLVVNSKVSGVHEGELATLFPPGPLVFVEAPDLDRTGPAVLEAWDRFAQSRLFRELSADPRFREVLPPLPAQVRDARQQIPEALAAVPFGGLDLSGDLIGRGCAAAVYAMDAGTTPGTPGAGGSPDTAGGAPGGPPPAPALDWLVATRVGKKIRLGVLLAGWAPASAIPPEVTLETVADGWKVTAQGRVPVFVGTHADVLLLAGSEARLAAARALGRTGLGDGSLAADPRFTATTASEPPGTEPVRAFVDLDTADRLWQVKERANLRLGTFPLNIFGEWVNAYQEQLFDLPLLSAGGGWLGCQPDGACTVRATVVADPSRRTGPAVARPAPGPPAALQLVPRTASTYATARIDFGTLWDRILTSPLPEAREAMEKNMQHYRDLMDQIVPLLGDDVTLIVGPAPAGDGGPGLGGRLPPLAAAIACTEDTEASRRAVEIAARFRDRFRERYPDERAPEIRTDTLPNGTLLHVHFPVLPKMFQSLGSDFSPSVLFAGGAAVLTTTQSFARTLAAVLEGREPLLRDDPAFLAGLAGDPAPCSAVVHFDCPAWGGLVARLAGPLAEGFTAIDWDAENAQLQAAGLLPNTPEWHAAQARVEERNRARSAATREALERSAMHLNLARSLSLRTTAIPALPGYRLDVRLLVDFSP